MMLAIARDGSVAPNNWSNDESRSWERSLAVESVVLVSWKLADVQKTTWLTA
jgi:hypothetical protein